MSLNRLFQGRKRRLPFCITAHLHLASPLRSLCSQPTEQPSKRACCVSLDKRGDDDDGRLAKGDCASTPHPSPPTPLRLTGKQGVSQFIYESRETFILGQHFVENYVFSLLTWTNFHKLITSSPSLSMISRPTDEGREVEGGGRKPENDFPRFLQSINTVGRSISDFE